MNALDRFGAYLTKKVSTMGCAVIFLAISLISLPAAIQANDMFVFISWLSQSFLQLVLLPIIMVGQKIATTEVVAPLHDHHERHHEMLNQIMTHLKLKQ